MKTHWLSQEVQSTSELRDAGKGVLRSFHPVISAWFRERFGEPSEPQAFGWPVIRRGQNVLISAPTGSGKTLAAFLCAVDGLVRQGAGGALAHTNQVLYVSPLKALANDIQKNLLEPLEGIRNTAALLKLDLPEIRPLVRTGDTLPRERRQMSRRPPHILVTTPESLFILLTTAGGRAMLKDVRTAIVDEIHALARDKRGSHLALSLERLQALAGGRVQRIGLSATQKPLDEIGCFLAGADRPFEVVNVGHRRPMELAVEVPGEELGAVATGELWQQIYERLVQLISEHRTTLIFVNTRRLVERVAHHLTGRLGEAQVAAHHGSLSREVRLAAEERLKKGELRAMVATASMELGIDIGSVDLVCQVGSTRSIALALQRIGRAGHWKGAVPRGRFFPLTRDDLLECATLVRAIREGELDRIRIPSAPLDVLAQQIVSAAAGEPWKEDELYALVRRAAPYAGLERRDFEALIGMLSEGISTRHGRRGAYLHRDRVHGLIRGRRGAQLAAVTSGGAIPDTADYLVRADPDDALVGTVDEDFAVESMQGDVFLLGNTSWRIRRVEAGTVRVEDARGAPPNIPFWRGEAPGRTDELSREFARLREEILHLSPEDALVRLREECGLDPGGADQALRYLQAGQAALGIVPGQTCIVAERFFDESGGMQLVLHAPFGSRINRAWGLALRKRFCRSFNFELQAAATENGILISLGERHSFPLESVFRFLGSRDVREILVQALLGAPLFPIRWRWTASRALAVPRFAQGRKVPLPLQRLRAVELLSAVFPDQLACQENLSGDIVVPDHPLVRETLRDCLGEALDADGLAELLSRLERGQVRTVALDTREPSPFSHEILNSQPFTFLDDAPLEERKARAVQTHRALVPEHFRDLASLDPGAIRQVLEEAWPPLQSTEEVHDALLTLGVLPEEELKERSAFLEELRGTRRAGRIIAGRRLFWFAAERLLLVRKLYPGARLELDLPSQERPGWLWDRDRNLDAEGAVREAVRGRLECTGPVTAEELASLLELPATAVEGALLALEAEGQILRGFFRSRSGPREWCDRRLLARIHRLTVGRLRREIEPVSAAHFLWFLTRWQHLAPGARLHGESGLAAVLDQLQGFEAPAVAWESSLLPRRVADFSPALLDRLCLSGQFVWGRWSRPAAFRNSVPAALNGGQTSSGRRVRPSRIAPIAFFRREEAPFYFNLRQETGTNGVSEEKGKAPALSHAACEILEQLNRWGACFLEDLVRTTGRLPVEVEEGLWELVAAGLASADGFDNLRALIDPRRRRGDRRPSRRRPGRSFPRAVGRWFLLSFQPSSTADSGLGPGAPPELEPLARQLLKRWGVVFRGVFARESPGVPWRELLMVLRTLEARGEVRGGRFVTGFSGEQFALPEAVESLRALRRAEPWDQEVRVSAADPLNLTGILMPGERIPPHPDTWLDLRDGVR